MSKLSALLGSRLRQNEPLGKFTAARLGGLADWLYIANGRNMFDELVEVTQLAWQEGLPVRILGGGANVLISDRGIRGLVVINRISQIEFGQWHDGRRASASGGTMLSTFARMCQQKGLSGMEWAISVPGTIGGAVVNNAGAHGSEMAQIVADVVVLEADKGPQLYTCEDLQYDYRHSILKARQDKRFLVLLTTFVLTEDEPAAILSRMTEHTAYRKRTQPPGASLGSIFKNPPDDYAGRLIEACGLKGYQIGAAQVSPIHANFMVNTGNASASDYYALIRHVQKVVFDKTGIELQPEIELLGDWQAG